MAGNNIDDDVRVRIDVDTPATLGDVFDNIQAHNEDENSHPIVVDHINNADIHVTPEEKEAWNSTNAESVAMAIEEHNDSTQAHSWLFSNKVDKEVGKGLSTEDFTTAEKNKLAKLQNLEQIQSNWKQEDSSAKDYIKNKPLGLSEFENNVGYIVEETDPVFVTSPAYNLTADDVISLKSQESVNEALIERFDTKVDKEEGKTLSSNDFTDLMKEKLEALPEPTAIILKSVQSINGVKPSEGGNIILGKEDVGLGQLVNETQVTRSEMGVPEGVATLNQDGKIPDEQIPELAISKTYKVDSEISMLALKAQIGDVAIRTDLNTTFRLSGTPANIKANWLEILAPLPPVTKVAGKVGDVKLNKIDVGLDKVDNTPDSSKPISVYTQRALDTKAEILYVDEKIKTGHTHNGINSSKISYTDIIGTPEPLQDVVYSPDSTKISKIRENAEGAFQYSTDGSNWKEIKTEQTTIKKDKFQDEEQPLEFLRLTDKVRHPAFLTLNVNGKVLMQSEYTILADEQTIQLKQPVAIDTPVEATYFVVAFVDDNTIKNYADSAKNSANEAQGYVEQAKQVLADYNTVIDQHLTEFVYPEIEEHLDEEVVPTINNYVTTNVMPSIDDLVADSADRQVVNVLEKNASAVVDNYMETTVIPNIDAHVEENTKPTIDQFVINEVMPGIHDKVDEAIDIKTDQYYENIVKPQVDNEIQTQVSAKVGDYVVEKAPGIVDVYIENTSLPKIDAYVENTSKPALDSYVANDLEAVINNMAKEKADEVVISYLDSDIKPTVDNYYETTLKPQVEQHVNDTIPPVIDSYIENTSKPTLDSYVENELKPIIVSKAETETATVVQNYIETDLATAVDNYYETSIIPLIDGYVENTSKPSIATYVDDVAIPEIVSKADEVVSSRVDEYIANEIAPALDTYVDTTSIPRIQKYVDDSAIPSLALKVDLAQQWANKTDGPVSGDEYSARWWAGQASSIVVNSTYTQEQIDAKLDKKQNKLTAGDYISIESNTVSFKDDEFVQTFTESQWNALSSSQQSAIPIAFIIEE